MRLPVSFIDLLFILLLAVIALTIPKNPIGRPAIDNPAQFLVETTWLDVSCSDIDTWMREPGGTVISFRNKQKGLYSLDRDDLGCSNDVTNINREVVTFRGWTEGPYIVNLHAFKFKDKQPIRATVRFIRLNPFKEMWTRTVTIEHHGQEVTVMTFNLNTDGDVIRKSENRVGLLK